MGMNLVFVPIRDISEETISYDLYLINETDHSFDLEYTFFLSNDTYFQDELNIESSGIKYIHSLLLDELNELPRMSCNFRISGSSKPVLPCMLKIRPKAFFKRFLNTQWFDTSVCVYELFNEFILPAPPQSHEAITQKLKEKKSFEPKGQGQNISLADKAGFKDYIDLHLEKLRPGIHREKKDIALLIQMEAFQKFLDTAIEIELKTVYVIHGVGEGKLKKEIHAQLKTHPYVWKYVNEYHPKYGYGATEIQLNRPFS